MTLGDKQFRNAKSLAAWMRKRSAGAGHLDHPGQVYPADHFDAYTEDRQRAAIQAALPLLADDADPDVVRFVTHLAREPAIAELLLRRLEGTGPPLDGAIARTVAEFVASRLFHEPPLRNRALAVFRKLGFHGPALSLVLSSGSARERVAAVALAAAGRELDEPLAMFAASRLAVQDGADPLLAAAASIFSQPEPIRRAFREGAIRSVPAWRDHLGLARTLHLSE